MRTYYIFNVNKYFSLIYKNKPFKMYKIFEDIYLNKDYDKQKTLRQFEEVARPFNKIMLSEYIYYEYHLKCGYKKEDNIHYLIGGETSKLTVNNYNIKLETKDNYSRFFRLLSYYNDNLFICDFENKDYFWLSKLYSNSLQNDKYLVK